MIRTESLVGVSREGHLENPDVLFVHRILFLYRGGWDEKLLES